MVCQINPNRSPLGAAGGKEGTWLLLVPLFFEIGTFGAPAHGYPLTVHYLETRKVSAKYSSILTEYKSTLGAKAT